MGDFHLIVGKRSQTSEACRIFSGYTVTARSLRYGNSGISRFVIS